MMRLIHCLLIFLFIIIFIGCSGGGAPTVPGMGGEGQFVSQANSPQDAAGHRLWGTYDLAFDPASGQIDVLRADSASMHFNTAAMLSSSECADCVKLKFAGLDKEKSIIRFDITLKNPFGVTGYDVRAVLITSDDSYYIVNADGATALYGDGKISTFLAFAKEQAYRAFGPGEEYTARGELHFPPEPHFRQLKLVIDVSYPGNCREPYAFNDFSFSSKTLSVGVLDWQDDVDDVRLMTSIIGASEDFALVHDSLSNVWSIDVTQAPGRFMIKGASFRGQLADGEIVASIDNPQAHLITCPVKASSGEKALWGYIILDVIDKPQETVVPEGGKMDYGLLEIYDNPNSREVEIRIIAYVAGASPDYLLNAKIIADMAFPEISVISEEVKAAYRKAQPEISRFAEQYGDAFIDGDPSAISIYKGILAKYGADRASLGGKIRQLEYLRGQRAKYAADYVKSIISPLQENVRRQINMVPDTEVISGEYLLNSLFITTKVKHLGEIANLSGIEYLQEDFTLVPLLDVSVPSIHAPTMWDAGYTGGTFDVLIPDSGVDATHPALSSHFASGQQKAFSGCSYDDSMGHGTHIAGIVASTNGTYRGVAYGLDKLYNGKICPPDYWDWFVAAFEWAGLGGSVSDPAEITNFSWGVGPETDCNRDGSWPTSRYFDASTFVYGQLYACASGNSGTGACIDDNIITMPADAFNVLAVGNMEDRDTISRADDRITDSSRTGPATTSNGEYRVKPDIAAPGTEIISCYFDWENNEDWAIMSGTSMAAPHGAGAAALIMDAGLTSSLEARILMMNTAIDWNGSSTGPGTDGPDIYTGFGYLQLGKALLNIGNVQAGVGQQGESRLYRHSGQSETDTVMLLWDRYCASSYNYYPDMDLYIYDEAGNTLLESENKSRDNKRYLSSGTTNDVIYKVNVNYIPLYSSWDYVLCATGGTLSGELEKPALVPEIICSQPVPVFTEFDISTKITNDGEFTIHNIKATLTLDSNMTFESGSTAAETWPDPLTPGGDCTLTWHVMLHSGSLPTKHIIVNTEAKAAGLTFTGQNQADISVDQGPPQLYVNPTELDFGYTTEALPFNIQNLGGGKVNWTIDDSTFPAWVNVDKLGGDTGSETDVVTVSVDRSILTPGAYECNIHVDSDAGDDYVHVVVAVANPVLNIQPANLDFGYATISLPFNIKNTGGSTLHWTIDDASFPAWLSVNQNSGNTYKETDIVNVMVDRTGIFPGDYNYDIPVNSDGGNDTVHVTMSVSDPVIGVEPATLDFGSIATKDYVTVTNKGTGILNWQILHDPPDEFPSWLKTDIDYGVIDESNPDDVITVTIDRTGLSNGIYIYDMHFSSDGGEEFVHIQMEVLLPEIHVEPDTLDFGETQISKSFTITNSTIGIVNWQITNAGEFPAWLNTDIASGQVNPSQPEDIVQVFVNRTGLTPGAYNFDIQITSNGGDAVVHILMAVHQPAPILDVNFDELNFGDTTEQMWFIISNVGDDGSLLDWEIPTADKPAWLDADVYGDEIDPTEMSQVNVTVHREDLPLGDYDYDMHVDSNGGNDVVHIHMTVAKDPLAPALLAPSDGYHYVVWTSLVFNWSGQAGYDGKYYIDVKLNGVPYAPFSNLPMPTTTLTLPSVLVDTLAKYGDWQWRIYIIESESNPEKHYSEWRTIHKDPPEFLTPDDGATVDKDTQFTWDKVASSDAANTWYVARLTGYAPQDPLYVWWKNTGNAILPPNWYQILKAAGGGEFKWTIAAASGDPSTAGGKGMTLAHAKKLKYPAARTFFVE